MSVFYGLLCGAVGLAVALLSLLLYAFADRHLKVRPSPFYLGPSCRLSHIVSNILYLVSYCSLLQVAPCIQRAAEIGCDDGNIREGFSEKKVAKDQERGPFDCIVIGSGNCDTLNTLSAS